MDRCRARTERGSGWRKMAEFESLLVFGCLAPVRPCNHTHAYQATRRALRMSALGQKRTFSDVRTMSALPPKADIAPCNYFVGRLVLSTRRPMTCFRVAGFS